MFKLLVFITLLYNGQTHTLTPEERYPSKEACAEFAENEGSQTLQAVLFMRYGLMPGKDYTVEYKCEPTTGA